MRTPPSLVSLAIDVALINVSNISDLSPIPEHILIELFLRTLRAGKLTEKILNLFIATGKEEILSLIDALNIQHVLTPVLPTSKSLLKTINSTPIWNCSDFSDLQNYFLRMF
ncbi:UDP-arabinopyranose mutase [Sarracenia purpurea var. burkii]